MKAPTIQSGKYRIRYRQIPYVERFFFVDIKKDSGEWDKDFMRIKAFHSHGYDLPFQEIFGFFQIAYVVNWNIDSKLYFKIIAFMNKVAQYDKYLDDKE